MLVALLVHEREEMAIVIKIGHIPGFEIRYEIDERDTIASSWPQSIDDAQARQDWGWNPLFDIDSLVSEMLENIKVPSSP